MGQILLFCLIHLSLYGCTTSRPKYPTDEQWNRTPIFKSDSKTLEVQGDFKNDVNKFLIAASKLKDNMTREDVRALGFDPELKNQPCDSIGWMETSQTITGNSVVNTRTIDEAVENRKQYSAVRCRARDIKIRTDRALTYLHHKDTYFKGVDLTLTIIFKKDSVIGVDLNKKPVKPHERQSAFFQILGEIIGTPQIQPDINKVIP